MTRRRRRHSDAFELPRLVLRGALGGTMIAHGVRHGRSLDGTAGWFDSIGFREPRLQAQASAAVVGTMAVAYRTVHRPNGYFITDEGWEYVGLIGAASVALSALGSGRWSADRALGLDRVGTPLSRGLLTAGLGVAGAAAQLTAFWREPA